ncbi:MAG: HlyD family type I secretion periplasmic adaptor subunit [Hyphomicrobium sp.]
MSKPSKPALPPDGPDWSLVPDESEKRVALAGWLVIAVFFGVFGAWAAVAPLNGAVVASGFVKVDGNRKSIQHLDGGIVRELHVREGATVKAGDILISLDDTQARAEFEIFSKQHLVLRATEERLRAEFASASQMDLPADLARRQNDADVRAAWRAEVQRFETRKRALAGQRALITERIAQLKAQVTGGEAQIKGINAQITSLTKERDSLMPLLKQGLVTRPRILQLERNGSGLEVQASAVTGEITRANEGIAEQMQQSAQLDNDQRAAVATELRDTQAKLAELLPRLSSAEASLNRMVVRSPYSGRVVSLSVFSVGGVIGRGERLLDIVPEREALVIDAQVKVEEISDVHPDMAADVHLVAYKQRTIPVVRGEVIQVSADRLTDQKSGAPYYVAQIAVGEHELASFPQVHLYPGMPVTVMIPTVERSALSYLVGPLMMSFNQAFRQK